MPSARPARSSRRNVKATSRFAPRRNRSFIKTLILCLLTLVVAFYGACIVTMMALRWLNPPTTSVQMQQRFQSLWHHGPYHKRARFVPLKQIAPALQHAVIAAEDARFYQHNGFDWIEVQKVIGQDLDRGELGRGGSTIDQQLVKNLFLSTSRSVVRKGVEATLVPLMERILPKNRILELYLNVIEWGPGIYGAEAASQYWYHTTAARLTREQAIRLAAIIPAPSRRNPARMNEYGGIIDGRMRQMGW